MSQRDTKQILKQKIRNNSKKMVNNEDYLHYVVRDMLVGETRMIPRYRGYGCGIATVTKFPHRTRTRTTRFGKTTGFSIPMLNPKSHALGCLRVVGVTFIQCIDNNNGDNRR